MEKPKPETSRDAFELASRQRGGHSGWIVTIVTALTPLALLGSLFVAEPARTANMFVNILGLGSQPAKADTLTYKPR